MSVADAAGAAGAADAADATGEAQGATTANATGEAQDAATPGTASPTYSTPAIDAASPTYSTSAIDAASPTASTQATSVARPAPGSGTTQPLLILNGPNLARLGTREPEVYGSTTLSDIAGSCTELGLRLGFSVELRQTDDEATLVGWLHEAADARTPVIFNPAAFTHYSYAIRDAAAQLTAPLVEIHLSNPASRERFRHTSVISGVSTGTIAGFGANSYLLAIQAMRELMSRARE